MRFISNAGKRDNHASEVCHLLKTAEKAWFFVAYLRNTGLAFLEVAVRRAARRIPIEIFCDIERCISEPEALQEVFRLLKGTAGKLYLVESSRIAFHPKLYCFFEGASIHILIGSANATAGGLEKNTEASLACTLPAEHRVAKDIAGFRDAILDGGATAEANTWNLRQYATRYGITDSKRRQAQMEAAAEIAKVQFLDLAQVRTNLREYRSYPENNREFSERTANYREARRIVERLCEERINSPKAFMEFYERLVGIRGEGQLWHSGGVHRSKSRVAPSYRHVIRLIRQLRANVSRTPEELFAIGLRYKQPIKGLGVNVLTEIMNTLAPKRFAVLNGNPLTTLEYFGHPKFPAQNRFGPVDYASFNEVQQFLRGFCEFDTVGQVDHFLNFVYWRKARASKQKA